MTQKITMGRDRRQDAIDAQNAMRQAGANPSVEGIAPQPRQDTGYQSIGSTGNIPVENPVNTTGNAELGTSATKSSQQDPEQFQTKALDERLEMYARAASNAGYSLNDRSRTGSI